MQETLGDTGSVPGLGRSLGGEHGNPLQYSCLENPMDRRAWRATVLGVAQSWTQLRRLGMGQKRKLDNGRQMLSNTGKNPKGNGEKLAG